MIRAFALLSLTLLPACAAAVVPVPLPAPSEKQSFNASGQQTAEVSAPLGTPALDSAAGS